VSRLRPREGIYVFLILIILLGGAWDKLFLNTDKPLSRSVQPAR
jgi:hypothetical protein